MVMRQPKKKQTTQPPTAFDPGYCARLTDASDRWDEFLGAVFRHFYAHGTSSAIETQIRGQRNGDCCEAVT